MPYKNPERKRQWERDHREQRNARRRKMALQPRFVENSQNPAPDPYFQVGDHLWTIAAGVAVILMVIAIAFIASRSYGSDFVSDSQARDDGS